MGCGASSDKGASSNKSSRGHDDTFKSLHRHFDPELSSNNDQNPDAAKHPLYSSSESCTSNDQTPDTTQPMHRNPDIEPCGDNDQTPSITGAMEQNPAQQQTDSASSNSAFVKEPSELQGEIVHTRLLKDDWGLGFTIVGGSEPDTEFVQIKSIVPNGVADLDGLLQIGDVLVSMNEHMVLGITQDDMLQLFQTAQAGDYVDLNVCRGYPLPFHLMDHQLSSYSYDHTGGFHLKPGTQNYGQPCNLPDPSGLHNYEYLLDDKPFDPHDRIVESNNIMDKSDTATQSVNSADQKISCNNMKNNNPSPPPVFVKDPSNVPQVQCETGQLDGRFSESDKSAQAIVGDIDMTCPSSTKIVRIFTSSTFTDTKNERNMLMKHAYPKVKEHCRRLGYEFQVVDMRWGVRDEATDDHMGTELCLKELKLCQQVSTGPNFVSFLSHKYGYIAFPRVIEATEYETFMAEIEEGGDSKQLFQRWYTLDNNAVPPAYILSPISSRLPDFISPEREKKNQAKQIWWDESEKMQLILDETATKVFDKDKARKYIMSVTETEVTEGLLKLENPSKHSLWFKRNIDDIEEQPSSYLLSRYIECMGDDKKWKKSRQMLKELKEDKIPKKLLEDRIMTYNVNWNPDTGINPEEKQHHDYLDNLCTDFVSKMKDMIDAGVAERARSNDHLVDECCQHIRFCQSKCEGFQGRQDTLELIKAYVKSSSTEPLVLHGTSGTGKTSIMAMAAKMMKQWTSDPPTVVLRFLGTSPDTSSIMPLLESLTSQIRRIYKMSPLPATVSKRETRCKEFKEALTLGRPDKPLLLMLDSLDQLDPAYDARKLGWLVTKLAPGTKVIVSTLPEPIYDCFPALQAILKSESSFVSVPVLDNSHVKSILESWLTTRQRRLTNHQMTAVLDAFKTCPTPLFLKLSFEEAATWSSFLSVDKTVLQDTVRASIDFLFQKLEKTHGQLLVSRALAYLTLANNGATEAELEDILSCDDDVLNDVYTYWTPPIRRLPPLLLVRVRTDLNQYLVERGADGVRVIYWYHRQFIEAAEARYCSDKETNRLIHKRLADFFNGTWTDGKKKPYTNAKGEGGEEDRHVSLQPLKFGPNNYNMRTLNNLPYHRTKAGQVELLKDQCLANPTFLIHKLEAAPIISLLRDFAMASEAFQDDDLIKEVLEALNLSQKALTTDARQIIPQLLLRLDESSGADQLLEACREYPSTYMLPTKCVLERPGGQLVHSISTNNQNIDRMDMTADGSLAVTVSVDDGAMAIWKVGEGIPKKARAIVGFRDCVNALFCNYDKWIVIYAQYSVVIQDVETGVTKMTVKNLRGLGDFFPFGKGRCYVMVMFNQQCQLMNLQADSDSDRITTLAHPETLDFDSFYKVSNVTGSDNYLALTADDQCSIIVYDLCAHKFRPSFTAFPENEEREYISQIKAIVIAPYESHIICANESYAEVLFTDFDGNRLKTIQRSDKYRDYRCLNITPDGSLLYANDYKALLFFDSESLQEVGKIEQHGITMARTNDGVKVLTVAMDGNLRIWDRSRRDQSMAETSQKCTTALHHFFYTHLLNNPRYLLLCGPIFENEEPLPNLRLEVYDVFQNTVVRSGEMEDSGGESVYCYQAFNTHNDDHLIMVLPMKHILGSERIVRIDLRTMTIVKDYIGFTTVVTMAEDTEEVFCTTRGSRHMKLYDKNGDFVTVMKVPGLEENISAIQVNTSGTIGCARCLDSGPLVLYDLVNRIHLYKIKQAGDELMYVNKAGTRLMFKSYGETSQQVSKKVNRLIILDISAAKEIGKLTDEESQKLLDATGSEDTVSFASVHELDSMRLLSTHDDNIIRIWNSQTGELLHRMSGHSNKAEASLCDRSPYICTYGGSDDEACFRLWDKTTYECVASFSLDKTVNEVAWSSDGTFLVSPMRHAADVTLWKVQNGHNHMTVNETDYPQSFSQSEETAAPMKVKIYNTTELHMDGDPDSDPEMIPRYIHRTS